MSIQPRLPRALILDFDGLVVDTEMAVYQAWQEFYGREGQHLTMDQWRGAVGYVNGFDPRAHLELLTRRRYDWPGHEVELVRRTRELAYAQPVLPGVEALLRQGARLGYRIGAASNSTEDWVGPGLERLGLRDWFETVRTRESVERHKPAPDVYLRALADLGITEPEHSFAFEDSEPGVRAAKAAGLYVVAVPNELTRGQDLSAADEVRASLEGYVLAGGW
jgi:HAD superfamily hydrolase (TIGR01509 family)